MTTLDDELTNTSI